MGCIPAAFACGCRHSRQWQALNVGRLAQWIDKGRLDPGAVITMRHLRDSGAVHKNVHDGVKLLAEVRARGVEGHGAFVWT